MPNIKRQISSELCSVQEHKFMKQGAVRKRAKLAGCLRNVSTSETPVKLLEKYGAHTKPQKHGNFVS